MAGMIGSLRFIAIAGSQSTRVDSGTQGIIFGRAD